MVERSPAILPLLILLFGHWSTLAGQNHPSAREPISVNPQDGLVLEKDTQIAVLVPENIRSKRPGNIKLIAASDLLIQDVVIIRRGEPALFNLAVDQPKRMSVGVALTLNVEGLRTLVGTDVPVTGRLRFDIREGCTLIETLRRRLKFAERSSVVNVARLDRKGLLQGQGADSVLPLAQPSPRRAKLRLTRLKPRA